MYIRELYQSNVLSTHCLFSFHVSDLSFFVFGFLFNDIVYFYPFILVLILVLVWLLHTYHKLNVHTPFLLGPK